MTVLRHADHPRGVICRPAGYGLCEPLRVPGGYSPALRLLNRQSRPALVLAFTSAYSSCTREQAGLMTIDQLKAGLLDWAKARNGAASLAGLLNRETS